MPDRPSARIVDVHVPEAPQGVVVVLHGGAARPGKTMVSPAQLSVLRMIPVARRVAAAGRDRLAVFRLLNSSRGWDTEHTPVMDATWAVGEITDRLRGARGPGGSGTDLPVALVGHSLGGRAALLAGTIEPVRSVVALNPWVYESDDVDLGGRRVLVVHGTDDRIADPRRSRAVADRIARRTELTWLDVPGGKHAMLRHGSVFEEAAASFVVETLVPGTSEQG